MYECTSEGKLQQQQHETNNTIYYEDYSKSQQQRKYNGTLKWDVKGTH